jgi:ATP-dependent Clp protease protease subunit
MKKPFFSVVSNKSDSIGRINIYGVIGPDWWGEGNEAKSFVRELNYLESKFDRIDIHINSPGGSIWDGLPIFNAIRASQKDIHTYVDGIAFSMGAIIALAGHTVHAAKGSLMMLHNASGASWGHANDMRSSADMLEKHDTVLAGLIADKTGSTQEEVVAKWLNFSDNFLTAQEALEAKLVDTIEDYEANDIPENAQNMTVHQLAAHYTERQEEPSEHLVSKIYKQIKNQFTNMKFTNLVALAGVENVTEAQLAQANADLTEAGVTNVTLVPESLISEATAVTAQRDALTATTETLTADLAAANTARQTAETDLAAANARIAELEAENTRLGALPGASHESKAGDDTPPGESTDQEYEALTSSMAHNKRADNLF